MIRIRLSNDNFINDIHPLVRAFLPGEDIEVSYDVSGSENDFILEVIREEDTLCSLSLPDTSKEDRLAMKNVLKCALYRKLENTLKKSLPWGTLTGIRPTRLALNKLLKGETAEDTLRFMEDYYLVSPEKAALSLSIAAKEKRIISGFSDPASFSLYVGIPFCPTTCLYCSFPSNALSIWKDRVGEYLTALEKELDFIAEEFKGRNLATLYIGGGTPTTLSPEELKRLFLFLGDRFDMKGLREFTVEAGRPDSIDKEKLKVLKEFGVDRISVNPQTMNDKTLKLIGRCHTAEETVKAFKLCREEGFDNINMDMILGLPGETREDVSYTLSEIEKLSPDDLTIHSLALKRGSALMERIEEYGSFGLKDPETILETAYEGAESMGLSPYYLYRQKNMAGNLENTGWARPGKEGLYNILMMEEVHSIPAAGAGTVSKNIVSPTDIRRCGNPKDVDTYIKNIDEMMDRKKRLYKD